MPALADRIVEGNEGPAVLSTGVPLAAIVKDLEAGAPVTSLGLDPFDLVAAMARLGLGAADSEGLPLVQGRPGRPKLERALSEPSLSALFPEARRASCLAMAAGLLQVHDFWDASHEAAQKADDLGEKRYSPYWHGIGHRREPDYGNAGYWFRRVGRHPLFPALGAAVLLILECESGDADRSRWPLDRVGDWNPDAFSELHREARRNVALEPLARRLQRLEMAMLLDLTVADLGAV